MSTRANLSRIVVGEQSQYLTVNAGFYAAEKLFDSINVRAVAGGNVTLGIADILCATLKLTGTLTADCVVTLPDGYEARLTVWNATSGAYSLTVKTAAGSIGEVVPQGVALGVVCDGTSVKTVGSANSASGAVDWASVQNKPTTFNSFGISGIPAQARITGFYNFRSAFQYESDVALTNQRAYWMRFAVEQTPVTISALRLYIASASAVGGVMQIRFCADNNAALGAVTHEFPNVATDAAGWVESSYGSNIVLQPGFYWLLCLPLFTGTAPTVTCYRGNDGRFGVGATEASEPGFYRNSISALPATGGTLGGSGTTASAIPRLRFRVP